MAIHSKRRRAAPTIVVVLIAVLGGSSCDEAPSQADGLEASAQSAAIVGGKLDPAPFRAEIEALENALNVSRPAEQEDYRRVGDAVLTLVNRISAGQTSIGRTASGKLLFFSAKAETAFADPRFDMNSIEKEWVELRDEYFAPAVWLRSPEQMRPRARVRSNVDPLDLASVERVVAGLEALMQRGKLEVIALGEPKYTPGRIDAVGQAQIDRWTEWGVGWQARVKQVTADLPEYPGITGPADLRAALESIDLAVLHLELVTQGKGEWPTPQRTEWEARFANAERALDGARR